MSSEKPSHPILDQPVSSAPWVGISSSRPVGTSTWGAKGAAPKAWNPSKMTWFFGEKKKGGNHKIIPTLLMEKIIGQPQVLGSPCLENRPIVVSNTTSSNPEPVAGRVPNRHSWSRNWGQLPAPVFFAGFWSATVKSCLRVPYLWRMFRAMNYWTWCSVWNPWNKSKKLRIGIICDRIRG